MSEQTRIHEEQMEDEETAKNAQTLRPRNAAGGTIPGSLREGQAPDEMIGVDAAPADQEERMRELEAARGEGQVGRIGETEIGTPAGRMEPGRDTHPADRDRQTQVGEQRGQHKDRRPENNVQNR